MSVSIPDFWSLCVQSRLLTAEQVQQLGQQFSGVKGAATQSNARTLAEWLIAQRVITRYQCSVLLSGRPGPFHYGEYVLRERIEEGRFSGCFRAAHTPTGHPVLIQFLSGPAIQEPNVWAAIAARAKANASVSHPLIHRLFEAADLGAYRFFVWDDLSGTTLSEVLAKSGRQSPQEASGIVWQAAIALGHLHQLGMVHGDVRPENLWIDGQGFVRLLRDGAGPPGPPAWHQPDPAGVSLLRADYAAPEFCQPEKQPDSYTDVYALGCTWYHLLAGRTPFAGPDALTKLSRHRAESPPPLEPLGVPPAVVQILGQFLAKNPAQRPPGGSQAAHAVAVLVERGRLQSALPNPPATCAAMEMWLRQRQTAAAQVQPFALGGGWPGQPAAPASGGFGELGLAIAQEPRFVFPSGNPAASAPVPAGSALPAMGLPVGAAVSPLAVGGAPLAVAQSAPAISISTSGKPARRRPAAAAQGSGEFLDNPKGIAILVGGVIALVAMVIVLFNVTRRQPTPPEDDPLAHATPGGETTKPPETAPPSTTPPKTAPKKPGPNEKPGPGTTPTLPDSTAPPKGTPTPPNPGGATETGDKVILVAATDTEWKMVPWVAPTTGGPVSLDFLPSGGLAYFSLRPSSIATNEEAGKVLGVLGFRFAAMLDGFEKSAGFKFADMEQLAIGLAADESGSPHYAAVVRLTKPADAADLANRWGNPPMTAVNNPDGKSVNVYNGSGWSYFIPEQGGGRMFVMAAGAKDAAQLIEQNGPPNLSKEMRRVIAASDQDRQFTVFVDPRHLFSDERRAVGGDLFKLIGPLQQFLGDDVTAASASLHVTDQSYLELRVAGSLDRTPADLAGAFRLKVSALPRQISDYVASLSSQPYWETVRFKFPRMIEMVEENTRMGPEGNTVIVNCILPKVAASNLMAASDLALASVPGAGGATAGPGPGESKPKSIEEVLLAKSSFSTPNASLEACVQQVQDDAQTLAKGVDFRIRILGKDLELEGITRNQAIRDFKQEGVPVADILTALVRKANPVTTVKDPSEKDQKLLWVVGPDPEDAKKRMVLITTRVSAEKKGYKLPAVFAPKGK